MKKRFLISTCFFSIIFIFTIATHPAAASSYGKRVRTVSSSEQKKKDQKKADELKSKTITTTSTTKTTTALAPVQRDNRICSQSAVSPTNTLLVNNEPKK